MSIKTLEYGKLPNGESVSQIVITSSSGMEARIITYGAAISHLFVRDKNNQPVDVVLGYECLEDYIRGNSSFGAVVGRHANRIKNAAIAIDGIDYSITANEGKNSLHSGPSNFVRKNFEYQIADEKSVIFYSVSPHGEEGFPGNLKLEVIYTLEDDNRLIVHYRAETDKATIANITNHSYFNLNGHDSGSVMGHLLMINGEAITETDQASIPNGNYLPVAGTPFDFTSEKAIGERIEEQHEQLIYGSGYDHNYVLKKQTNLSEPELAARLKGDKTGIVMNTYTTQPGMQFYTANYLNEGIPGKNGTAYGRREGICLETQHFPASPSNPHFPSVILRPGEEYRQTAIFEFVK